MSEKIVVNLAQLNHTEDYAFIGLDDEVGLVLVPHDGKAHIFTGLGVAEYQELLDIVEEESARDMEDYFLSEYGDEIPSHVDGVILFSVDGARQVSFPLTQDTPQEMIAISLIPHIVEKDGKEWVREDDKAFRADRACWLLPKSASPEFLDGLRDILRAEGIPAQLARYRADGKSRLVTIGLSQSVTFVMEKEIPGDEEPEPEHDVPETDVVNSTKGGGRLVSLVERQGGEEPAEESEVLTIEDLPPNSQSALEDGLRHGIPQLLVEDTTSEALLLAIAQAHVHMAHKLGMAELKVLLPRTLHGEKIPNEVVKKLVEAGIGVSWHTSQENRVGIQLEPS